MREAEAYTARHTLLISAHTEDIDVKGGVAVHARTFSLRVYWPTWYGSHMRRGAFSPVLSYCRPQRKSLPKQYQNLTR